MTFKWNTKHIWSTQKKKEISLNRFSKKIVDTRYRNVECKPLFPVVTGDWSSFQSIRYPRNCNKFPYCLTFFSWFSDLLQQKWLSLIKTIYPCGEFLECWLWRQLSFARYHYYMQMKFKTVNSKIICLFVPYKEINFIHLITNVHAFGMYW